MATSSENFPRAVTGLPDARASETVELADGERYALRIAPVAKRLGDATVRMLAYNGSIPGPTLRVHQGSHLVVDAFNEADLEATVHWHGLRLDNRFDGTLSTQPAIPVGGSFTYRIDFPDSGVYWYHPHIREDYGQEMGLYGNIVVAPADAAYWPPVDRELTLTLDDVLLDDGGIAPFSRSITNHVAMGRYGNVLLINGEPDLALRARRDEVVRFYLTNTANSRVFNVGLAGAQIKLVGGDSGHVEHEQMVERVLIAPSERVVVDVLFDRPGELALNHHTPGRTHRLATITVEESPAQPSSGGCFAELRTNGDMVAERERSRTELDAPADKTIALVAEMDMGEPELPPGTAVAYACPMHPEVISDEPGRCPKCGMKLLAVAAPPIAYACPMHPEVTSDQADRCPKCGMKLVPAQLLSQPAAPSHHGGASAEGAAAESGHGDGTHGDGGHREGGHGNGQHSDGGHEHGEHAHAPGGIEWEDDMVEVNRLTTPANTRWKIIDRATGAEGMDIDWRFRVGDRVKIRVVNEMDSDHPMHHPFHIHGAGRFLILARDGQPELNLTWKDTVLIPTGQTVDLMLEVTNPGVWMAHCHIAEHHESGMMFRFTVDA